MATDKRQFTLRLQPDSFEKLKYISEFEHRSISMQIEHVVLEYIKNFETNQGKILLPSSEDLDE